MAIQPLCLWVTGQFKAGGGLSVSPWREAVAVGIFFAKPPIYALEAG
jgi:hypothetical protein